jgi:hypothetical protein
MRKFSYAINEYDSQYTVMLALNPESLEIFTHAYVGCASVPMRVFHNLDINLFHAPSGFVAESLIKWFETKEVQAVLQNILSGYEGSEWNGSNYVGKWLSTDGSLPDCEYDCHQLEQLLAESISSLEIQCYWGIDTFFTDVSDAKEYIDGCTNLESAIESIKDAADNVNILLKDDEVRDFLIENFAPWQ